MKFYTYSQNNSGGNFHYDDKAGIGEYVIVEAENPDAASAKAQDIGIYFGGVSDGRDCGCCGDRWSDYLDDGDDVPSLYGKPVSNDEVGNRWRDSGPSVFVHYADGTVKSYPEQK